MKKLLYIMFAFTVLTLIPKISLSNQHNGIYYAHNQEEFNTLIQQPLVIVDFYADRCGPCKKLAPILEQLVQEFPAITFVKINADAPQTAHLIQTYRIMGLPTLLFFKNGQRVEKIVGLQTKQELKAIFARIFGQ